MYNMSTTYIHLGKGGLVEAGDGVWVRGLLYVF